MLASRPGGDQGVLGPTPGSVGGKQDLIRATQTCFCMEGWDGVASHLTQRTITRKIELVGSHT